MGRLVARHRDAAACECRAVAEGNGMKTENTIPAPLTAATENTIPTPLAAAVALMMREIDEAFAAPSQPGKERLPYINALVAVSRFAKFAGLSPADKRLHELAQRLDDLERGRVDPLLTPNAGPGTKTDSNETWYKRTRVLVAFKCLRKAGMNQRQAARYIAENFPGLSTLMTRGKKLQAAILNWQRSVHEDPQLRQYGDDLFNHHFPMLDQTSLRPEQWRQMAHNLLDKPLTQV